MDKALYDDIVLYLRDGVYRTGNSRIRFLVRQAAHRYSINGRRLQQGSLVVLHEEEAFDVLRSLHLRKQHLRGPEFICAGRKTYVVPRGKVLCFEVVRCLLCSLFRDLHPHQRMWSSHSLFGPTV